MQKPAFDWRTLSALLAIAMLSIIAPTAGAKTEETCNSSIAKCGDNPSDGDGCWVNKTNHEGDTVRLDGTVNKTGDNATCVYGRRDINGDVIVSPPPVIDGVTNVSPTTGGRFSGADAAVGAREHSGASTPRAMSNRLPAPTADSPALAGTCASVCLAGTLWAICEKPEGPGSEAKAAGPCPAGRFDVTVSEDGRRIKTIPLNDAH